MIPVLYAFYLLQWANESQNATAGETQHHVLLQLCGIIYIVTGKTLCLGR